MSARSPVGARWPALDGLRGLAIVLVILTHLGQFGPHAFSRLTQGGVVGVDVFFVLSGFLITSLLVTEWERTSGIGLGRFYMRRGLRLLPALLVCVGMVVVASLALVPHQYREPTLGAVPYALFYGSDLRWLIPGASPSHSGLLDPTWSLSIEEQFYFVWPAVLLVLLAKIRGDASMRIMQVALAGAALVGLHRALLYVHGGASWFRMYASPDTHTDGLLIGCALAILVRRCSVDRRLLGAAGATGLATVLWFAFDSGPAAWGQPALYLRYDGFGLIAVATAALIWSLVADATPRWSRATFRSRPLCFVGSISYGLYLWNLPVMDTLGLPGVPLVLADAIRVAVTFCLAIASYYVVERRFLRMKARSWSSDAGVPELARGDTVAGAAPPAGVPDVAV